MVRGAGITWPLTRRIEGAACAHPVSRAAIPFFVNMKAVPARGQSGNLRLDGKLVTLLRKRDGAGRGVPLGRFQPRGGGLSMHRQRGANGERTDGRGEYQMLHGTSWKTTTHDWCGGTVEASNDKRTPTPCQTPQVKPNDTFAEKFADDPVPASACMRYTLALLRGQEPKQPRRDQQPTEGSTMI